MRFPAKDEFYKKIKIDFFYVEFQEKQFLFEIFFRIFTRSLEIQQNLFLE